MTSLLVFPVLLGLVGSASAQPPAAVGPDQSIAGVQTQFTCEEANRLKFKEDEYRKLDIDSRVLLDAQWQKCEVDRAGGEKTVVVMTNPAPTEGASKVFYGTIRRKDLENAEKNCAGGGKVVGASLVVVGAATGVDSTGQLGQGIYEYSGVGCGDLKQAIANGNVLALLGPTAIVEHAVQKKLTHDILKQIPVISKADKKNLENVLEKTTRPPEVTIKNGEVTVRTPLGKAKMKLPKL